MEQASYGFWGRMLRVNLTTGATRVEEPDPKIYRRYIGGTSLALYYLLREMPAGVDPLGPDNLIAITTSPTTGCQISGQARHTVAARSPLTGGLADSQCGGWWGAELKFAGWDGILIQGRAESPVYLSIEDETVQILPADNLSGKTTGEVDDLLHEAHPGKVRILQCGPAGENLVRFAALTADLRHFHGRGGLGTVFGSKHLRAIVVKGSHRKLAIADPEGLKTVRNWFNRGLKEHPAITVHHELGTPKGVMPLSVQGLLPTYNFQDGSFAAAEQVSGEAMNHEIGVGAESCYACGVACKRVVEGERDGFRVTRQYGGPEYESLGLLGPNLGVDNIVAIAECNERCNALGLDTISSGGTLAWAIECVERGLLSAADFDGMALTWNDPATYLTLLEKIARREGVGDILAEGSLRAAQQFGRGTARYALQVKGQEFPSHEPRGKWGVALGYAVSPNGADHLRAAHDPWFTKPGDYSTEYNYVDLEDLSPLGIIDPVPAEDLSPAKVRLFLYLQYVWSLHDVIEWCIFTAVPEFRALSLNQLTEIVRCVTGWRTSLFELLKVGERAITMARVFNCREGFSAKDDTLPERMFEPMRAGTLQGHAIDRQQFEEALTTYYGMMGWDAQGIPTKAKLEELDVGWLWEQLDMEQSSSSRQ
ncbi:aldehyde ferredoxin oxidoreductase [candidate division KSB3 bacterium]|uniref:Aldehyde ferredoxin oxidoreductase n=1 Tax=candidate division KSB3 bacterium TaxID=2044937 RepID=A0A9D5Q8J8_9BACT|nr:aldehyde ferredoxin oxidoreductase [candidate division KSB3 bacterium]MBD3327432.1 aldehyde ferredoxin oxidoreductase [candidate division KSB3 bacterium]